jgi:hypothetical protein
VHTESLQKLLKFNISIKKIRSVLLVWKKTYIFCSLLTIGDSFAKNLNLLAQKEKNTILLKRPDLAWIEVGYVQCLEYVGVF